MKTQKTFDAVAFMRQVRDKMNKGMQGMNFDAQKNYIRKHASGLRKELEQERRQRAV